MDNKLKELHDRRAKACADFCRGVPTKALEGGWGLFGILSVLAELGRCSHGGVAKNLAQSIFSQIRRMDDHKAD